MNPNRVSKRAARSSMGCPHGPDADLLDNQDRATDSILKQTEAYTRS